MPDNDHTGWPEHAMTYYLSGYQAGLERGRQVAGAEMAAAWAAVAHMVHAAAKLEPFTVAEQARKARQIASCERQKQEARPWPPEDPP